MLRLYYLAGMTYMVLCAVAIRAAGRPVTPPAEAVRPVKAEVEPVQQVVATGDASAWFQSIKPFCNSVEVLTALARSRPPAGTQGAAYEAGCLALAGKVDRARDVIAQLEGSERAPAAGIVFEIAHPVADAGDDRSAGPIMAMVVEFWPNHYMALYHAGMSEVALGATDLARRHLEAFMQEYKVEDGWRSSARGALERLGQQ
jgi:hypothetical protein